MGVSGQLNNPSPASGEQIHWRLPEPFWVLPRKEIFVFV
jgi:hypothetical protein